MCILDQFMIITQIDISHFCYISLPLLVFISPEWSVTQKTTESTLKNYQDGGLETISFVMFHTFYSAN
jgi:hypothetical protein